MVFHSCKPPLQISTDTQQVQSLYLSSSHCLLGRNVSDDPTSVRNVLSFYGQVQLTLNPTRYRFKQRSVATCAHLNARSRMGKVEGMRGNQAKFKRMLRHSKRKVIMASSNARARICFCQKVIQSGGISANILTISEFLLPQMITSCQQLSLLSKQTWCSKAIPASCRI